MSKEGRDSAYLAGAIDDRRGIELEKTLDSILHGTPRQRAKFLACVDWEIDAYQKLFKPGIAWEAESAARLATFEKAARSYQRALKALTRRDLRRLRRCLMTASRRHLASHNPAIADAQFARAAVELEGIKASGPFAEAAAEAINGEAEALTAHRENAPRRRNIGTPIDGADRGLVKRIAELYAAIFGERPSPAAEGIFSRALSAILAMYELKILMGEKRLSDIIDGADVLAVPPPKRGPKKRPPE